MATDKFYTPESSERVLSLMGLIDDKFEIYRGKVSRLSLEWGVWSREMNLEVRAHTDNHDDPDRDLWVWLFNYWVNKSRQLDDPDNPELQAEGEDLRETILNPEAVVGDTPGIAVADIIRDILKGEGER